MEYLLNALKKLLLSIGLNASIADWSSILALVIASLLVIFLLDFIIRTIIRVIFSKIASRSKTNFDDIMVAHKVPRNIAHILSLIHI